MVLIGHKMSVIDGQASPESLEVHSLVVQEQLVISMSLSASPESAQLPFGGSEAKSKADL